jgi:hypothetical protein
VRSFANIALVVAITGVGITRWCNAVAADPDRPIWAEEVRRYESGESQIIRVTPAGSVLRPVKPSSQVEYRSHSSSDDWHLIVNMPRLGKPLTIRLEAGNPGTKGVLFLEPGRASIRNPDSTSSEEAASAPSVFGIMLPNPSEGPGLAIPFLLDASGIGLVELKLAEDPLYLGRTYSMQARIGDDDPAYTEVVSIRLGK